MLLCCWLSDDGVELTTVLFTTCEVMALMADRGWYDVGILSVMERLPCECSWYIGDRLGLRSVR